jgi:uncharacterized protein YjcR
MSGKPKEQPHAPTWLRGLAVARAAPRCQARRKRDREPCRNPAANGKRVCRMHGGAHGSGAPRGNVNALRHGIYSVAAKAERALLRRLMSSMRQALGKIV